MVRSEGSDHKGDDWVGNDLIERDDIRWENMIRNGLIGLEKIGWVGRK
jgi:hypothetical protein